MPYVLFFFSVFFIMVGVFSSCSKAQENPQSIEISTTICSKEDSNHCRQLTHSTTFVSLVQCQIFSQMALSEIMKHHPKYRVARYSCNLVEIGESI